MPERADYYKILQVHPSAGKEVIDAAYRKLALKYHPDLNHSADAADKMKQINQAYDVLSNPTKRSAYDRANRTSVSITSRGINWHKLKIITAVVLLVIATAKFKILGLLLMALLVAIFVLRR